MQKTIKSVTLQEHGAPHTRYIKNVYPSFLVRYYNIKEIMVQQVNWYTFSDWFQKSDTYKNNFTYAGLKALFDYLEQYEEDTGEPIEFDPIALCCEFSEYKSAWDAMEQYQPEDMPTEGEEGDDLVEIQEKNEAEALRWLEERTTVIPFDDNTLDGRGIIISNF